jgi:hypothetical protein
MAITEGKQRFIGVQGSHVSDVGNQSNESNLQGAVRTGAQAARHKKSSESQN